MNKLLKNTVYYSIGEVCPRIISFFLLPIYTHFLSPTDYGILSYTNTVMLFLVALGTLALNSFVLRYYFIWNSENDRRKLIGSVVSVILLMNLLILGLAFTFLPQLIEKYHVQVPWDPYFRLAVILNFLDSFSILPLVIYRVRQDALTFIKLNLGKTLLQVGFNLFFIVYLQIGLIGYYYSMLCTYIPYFCIYLYIIKKYATFSFDLAIIKEGLRFSLPLLPGALAYLILSVSDRIILERNVPMAEIGIYNVAFTMALALNIVIQSGYKAIEPEIFKRYGATDYFSFIKKLQSIFFIAIYVVGMCICLFSQEAFYFMTGPNFHEGYKLVPLLIVGVVMSGQNVIYSGILSAEKRTKIIGFITLTGGILSITFNLALIPVGGIYAAAISSAVSFTVMNTLLYKAMHFEGKSIYRESLCVVVIPLLVYTIFYIFPKISVVTFFIKLLFVLLYVICCFKLLGFKLTDLKVVFLTLIQKKIS